MWIIAWLVFFKSFFLVLVKSVLQKYQKISSLQQRDFYRIKTYYIEYFLVFFLMDFIVNYPINSESNLKKPWFYQCFLSVSIPLLWFHQKNLFFSFLLWFFFLQWNVSICISISYWNRFKIDIVINHFLFSLFSTFFPDMFFFLKNRRVIA